MTENEKLKLVIERQANQIAKLKKVSKKPFHVPEKHLGIVIGMLIPFINMTFDFGLSEWELMIYMVPPLLFAYLGKNKNA